MSIKLIIITIGYLEVFLWKGVSPGAWHNLPTEKLDKQDECADRPKE